MGVQVDEAGRHGHALGVDLLLAVAVDVADLADTSVADGEVAVRRFCAGAVYQFTAADDKIVHWTVPLNPLNSPIVGLGGGRVKRKGNAGGPPAVRGGQLFGSCVGNPVDSAALVVRDQQAAVGGDEHVVGSPRGALAV